MRERVWKYYKRNRQNCSTQTYNNAQAQQQRFALECPSLNFLSLFFALSQTCMNRENNFGLYGLNNILCLRRERMRDVNDTSDMRILLTSATFNCAVYVILYRSSQCIARILGLCKANWDIVMNFSYFFFSIFLFLLILFCVFLYFYGFLF